MLMADDGQNYFNRESSIWDDDLDDDNLYVDFGELFDDLDRSPRSGQVMLGEQPLNVVTQGSPIMGGVFSSACETSSSDTISPSLDFGTSVSRTEVSNQFSGSAGMSNGMCGPVGVPNAFCDLGGMSNGFYDHVPNPNGVKLESFQKLDSPAHSFCGSLGEWIPFQDPRPLNDMETISCHGLSTVGAVDSKGFENGRPERHETFSFAAMNFDGFTVKTDGSSFGCSNNGTDFQPTCFGGNYFTEGVPGMNGFPSVGLPYDSSTVRSLSIPSPRQFFPDDLFCKVAYSSSGKMSASRNEEVQISNEHSRISGGASPSGGNSSCLDHCVSYSMQKAELFVDEEKLVHEFKRPRLDLHNCDGSSSGMMISGSSNCLQNEQSGESSFLLSSSLKKEQGSNLVLERCQEVHNFLNNDRIDASFGGSNLSSQKIENNQLSQKENYRDDDDSDLCILEDISAPARPTISSTNCKPQLVAQRTMMCDSFGPSVVGPVTMKPKSKDEQSVFQAALQDLSQPRSEDTPSEGLLAVPLLRHQRIALSWMVKKEKDITCCSGGILADDQGLGKTISTIALILKEKPPTTMGSITPIEPVTFNLDEDDGVPNIEKLDEGDGSYQVGGSVYGNKCPPLQAKRKPVAGTLIVCPTSVLRQWSEEFQNKVNSEAGLSVLVYHGANRTKDPFELAKFDVVITTYSIVSMEVPKQPLADDDDDDLKSASGLPVKLPSCKKRKYPPSGCKKSLKCQKALEEKLAESLSRPLGSVRWFRVVLDEAQSIKNHRTQVARACWGLRAKRRWCLSGTPIQNAIDDLYSYFRFLRYDPYSKYQSFCMALKGPIQRSPANGYKKLQAVLKTVMLRRTKGTVLDGEPIICLPPKHIQMKQVDFTEEERDFYSRLEADSRAQFAEYAAAGTVKQNYVNILLMLLRLRQACDHPLLVRSSGSNSMHRSSLEMVKKLPREKRIYLLNCLEDSLAICGICSDPPEEAVVTSCGHVFCNQCVCDHITGEDTHCPSANCKATVSKSHIFSLATLRSLCDESHVENNSNCSQCEFPEEPGSPSSFSGAFESSKIKAALQVLGSLSKQCASCFKPVEEKPYVADNMVTLLNELVDNKQGYEVTEAGKVSDGSTPSVGEKAIVFSQWTRMLDLLEVGLKNSSIQYRRLDGTMSVAARDKAVKDFKTLPEVTVIIMSLKAASLGLNLVTASHVLLLDLWWNPTTEDQAIDRAHRIGQTRPVTVLRLTVKDTVEDRILALQEKKRKMVASAFGEDEKGSSRTRLTEEDLQYLFADAE